MCHNNKKINIQKKLFLSILFGILSTPLFILSAQKKSNEQGYRVRFTRDGRRAKNKKPLAPENRQYLDKQTSNCSNQKYEDTASNDTEAAQNLEEQKKASESSETNAQIFKHRLHTLGYGDTVFVMMPGFMYIGRPLNPKTARELTEQAQRVQDYAAFKAFYINILEEAERERLNGYLSHPSHTKNTLPLENRIIQRPKKPITGQPLPISY